MDEHTRYHLSTPFAPRSLPSAERSFLAVSALPMPRPGSTWQQGGAAGPEAPSSPSAGSGHARRS